MYSKTRHAKTAALYGKRLERLYRKVRIQTIGLMSEEFKEIKENSHALEGLEKGQNGAG